MRFRYRDGPGSQGGLGWRFKTFSNPVHRADNKSRLGTDEGYCVRVSVGKIWACSWTVILAQGQNRVEGPFYDARDSLLAVIGGAGGKICRC